MTTKKFKTAVRAFMDLFQTKQIYQDGVELWSKMCFMVSPWRVLASSSTSMFVANSQDTEEMRNMINLARSTCSHL